MKQISISGTKYSLDTSTQRGKDLYSAYLLVIMFGMPPISEDELPVEAVVELTEARQIDHHPYNPSYKAAAVLCSKYQDKVAYHIAYVAYKNLPVSYRPQAIEALSKVLAFGGAPAFAIYQQGLQLAKEYQFDEALAHIRKAIDMAPHDPLYHVWYANTLVKTNDLDGALAVLYAYRETEYYKQGTVKTEIGNQTMQQMDYTIADIEAKKARGYVYRPKRRKAP